MPTKKNLPAFLNDFLVALSFLTVLPISVEVSDKKNALARAMMFFPLIGLGIAAVSLGAAHVLKPYFPERLINLLLVLFPIVISGCLHTDGLADFFDGFFQGKNKEDILAVMKDPHIGVWGVMGILFFVLLKWELLMIVPFKEKIFLIAITLSRWAQVFLSSLQPYARREGGLGESVAGQVGGVQLAIAGIITILVSLMIGIKGVIAFIVIGVFVFLMGKFCQRRIGGITGDLIGATGEMSELLTYFLFVILMRGHFLS